MAGYINPYYVDLALTAMDNNINSLVICSAMPATFEEAGTTYKLGTKATPTVSAPQAASPDGRKITVSAITDGTVSANGTATHFALLDTINSRLVAAQALSASQVVSSGNTFTLSAVDIRIPAAV
jgi:hypothetical protein